MRLKVAGVNAIGRAAGLIVLAGLAGLAIVAAAAALAVGFERIARLVPGGHQIRVSVIAPPCAAGEKISVALLVRQGFRTASGRSVPRACPRRAQHWQVSVTGARGEVFREGTAKAHAQAIVTRAQKRITARRWTDTLVLRCPGPPRSPHNGLLAQINLDPPRASSQTGGIAVVLRHRGIISLLLAAQGMKPNTHHNAYAVWLYNSSKDNHLLGFVNPGVTSDGRLRTAGTLPAHSGCFRLLIVSLETEQTPAHPHKIALSGKFTLS